MTAADQHKKNCPWSLAAAAGFVGLSTGALVVALVLLFGGRPAMLLTTHEWIAALGAGVGVWSASPIPSARNGIIAIFAAIAGMLLADLFRALHLLTPLHWAWAPAVVAGQFVDPEQNLSWSKLLRYVFGMYLGWHLGRSGRC